MANNAAAMYKDSKIQTASPADLTLMLYEGANSVMLLLLVLNREIFKKHMTTS